MFELAEKELLLIATHYLDTHMNVLENNGDQEATEKIDRYKIQLFCSTFTTIREF